MKTKCNGFIRIPNDDNSQEFDDGSDSGGTWMPEDPSWDNLESPGGGGGDSNDGEAEDVKIDNEIDDPCASQIFLQLQLLSMDHELPPSISYDSINGLDTDLDFSNAILNLFNDSDQFDYIVNEDNSLSENTNAQTNPSVNYNSSTERYEVSTSFNPDYFDDATDFSMARTMIHESVHAYLVYVQRGEPMGNMMDALNSYISENELPNTVNNDLHHNFMAQFIDAVAYQLWEWDINHGTGGTLDWQYYQDIAWGGLAINPDDDEPYDEFDNYLDETVANLDADESLRNEIEDRILESIENENENYSGSSQDGQENNCQ